MSKPKLSSYEPVSVSMPVEKVTDDQVEQEMQRVARQVPTYADAGGANADEVAPHDKVRVRVTWLDDGKPMKGFDDAKLTITVGDGFMPLDFAQGIVGMKVGDHKEYEFAMAAKGAEDENDKSQVIQAKVDLLEIRKRTQSKLDDAWVKKFAPNMETVEEMRVKVRKQLEDKLSKKRIQQQRAMCSAALARRLEGAPSDEAINRALAGVRADFEKMCVDRGITREQYLKQANQTEEQFNESLAQQAAEVAAEGEALEAMADHLDIQVSQEELDAAAEKNLKGNPLAWRNYQQNGDADGKVLRIARCEKALDYVSSHALLQMEFPTRNANPFGAGTTMM